MTVKGKLLQDSEQMNDMTELQIPVMLCREKVSEEMTKQERYYYKPGHR
jgi:hypothetical protein